MAETSLELAEEVRLLFFSMLTIFFLLINLFTFLNFYVIFAVLG